ncbi:hypothetical protein [Pseudomonas bohemica]|uniref:hypothetical protein n=1 Tax=Pseudomonas bohemica TaxID=2044872 RepID=UPI000DA61BBD|nr:hypothetical protein [Pseudomonas bohemica]
MNPTVYKHVPVDTGLAMYGVSSNVPSATNDVSNVTGANTTDQRTSHTTVNVDVIDGVVSEYRLN